MDNRSSRRLRRFRRNVTLGILFACAFAAWTYHGARRKSLNLGLLQAVDSSQNFLASGKRKNAEYFRYAQEAETLIQQGADPNVHTSAYPYGSFPSELRQRFQWNLLDPWSYRYRNDFGSDDRRDMGPPLIWSVASQQDRAIYDVLLKHNIDPNATSESWEQNRVTNESWTRHGVTLLMIVAEWGDSEALAHLLHLHPHINMRDSMGATPLLHAIYHRHPKAVRLLLQSGASPNIGDKFGYTPLMNLAMAADADMTDMAALLLEFHADVNQRNAFHKTALTLAREQRNTRLIPYLLQHGAQE